MKLSKGRGIQFFKQPFFSRHGVYFNNIYKASKKGVVGAVKFVGLNKQKDNK
jgi:hypothetical protein